MYAHPESAPHVNLTIRVDYSPASLASQRLVCQHFSLALFEGCYESGNGDHKSGSFHAGAWEYLEALLEPGNYWRLYDYEAQHYLPPADTECTHGNSSMCRRKQAEASHRGPTHIPSQSNTILLLNIGPAVLECFEIHYVLCRGVCGLCGCGSRSPWFGGLDLLAVLRKLWRIERLEGNQGGLMYSPAIR